VQKNIKMKKLKKIFFIISLTILYLNCYSQDAAFSQFYAAPIFLNPAMAGGENYVSVNVTYRTNTNKVLFPYNLGQFTATLPLKFNSRRYSGNRLQLDNYIGTIAVTAYNEYVGYNSELKVSGLSLTTSYFMQVALAHFISFGLQTGFIQKVIDFDKLTWGSQFDTDLGFDSRISPSVSLANGQKTIPVINAGFTWYYNAKNFSPYKNSKFRAFSGFAVSNLNRPDESFLQVEKTHIPLLFKLHGGLGFEFANNFELLPNVLIMRQNNHNQINVGTYVAYYVSNRKIRTSNFYQIQLGSWYRVGDSYIVSLGFEMLNLILGFSYDFNLSSFQYNDKGVRAFEISIKYRSIPNKQEMHRNISHPII